MTGKITQESFEQWINKEGYPFEFFVEARLRSAGFQTYSGFYLPGKEGVLREVDLIAAITEEANDITCHVFLLIECKSPPKGAAILCSADDGAPQSIRRTFGVSNLADSLVYLAERRGPLTFSPKSECTGFGVVTGPRDDKTRDFGYLAMTHAVEAALEMAKQFEEADPINQIKKNGPTAAVVAIPVVAWGNALFQASYSEADDKVLSTPISSGTVRWLGESISAFQRDVLFVSKDGMDSWAKSALIECTALAKAMALSTKSLIETIHDGPLRAPNIGLGSSDVPQIIRDSAAPR